MDFFAAQDRARRNTGWLVALFVLAVLGIVGLTYVAVAIAVLALQSRDMSIGVGLFDPLLILSVGAGVMTLVGMGSLFKLAQLRSGGRAVAELLGGRLLDAGAREADERKLLNVVQEMAIASGTPVPPVYVMDQERAINAFAAGWSPDDAVIGVTRGTIETLSRDELQGVIAHEFSHILNGDMRLNLRLVGVLNGILVIGLTGYAIVRSLRYAAYASTSRRSKGGGQAVLVIIVLGAALIVIGSIGVFFGKIIKAAVSRQREFLADSSAVQFTRLPEGLAGALKKIGGISGGSTLVHPKAEEASHMYFAGGISYALASLFSTHPPLKDRIRRLEPNWDGSFPKVALPAMTQSRSSVPQQRHRASVMGASMLAGATDGPAQTIDREAIRASVESIGQPTQHHIEYARELVRALPERLVEAAHEPYGARAVVYGLLLDSDETIRDTQWSVLAQQADGGPVVALRSLAPAFEQLDVRARLPLLDICIPALKELSPDQHRSFRTTVEALIQADEQVDLFVWVLKRLLEQHLDAHFTRARPPVTMFYNLKRLGPVCSVLLSSLAWVGSSDPEAAKTAFRRGATLLGVAGLSLLDPRACRPSKLDEAISVLATVTSRNKQHLIEAAIATVAADDRVTLNEGELLRGIADALGCPMPPLLPGIHVAS